MCVGLFSITAHAEEIKDDYVYIQGQISVDDVYNYEFISYPQDGVNQEVQWNVSVNNPRIENKIKRTFYIAKKNKSNLFVNDRSVTVRFENIPLVTSFKSNYNGQTYTYVNAKDWSLAVYYNDNSVDYISDFKATYNSKEGNYDVVFNFLPKKDVSQIYIHCIQDLRDNSNFNNYIYNPNSSYELYVRAGETNDNCYELNIEQDTKETGLLSGILGKLTDGFNSLGEKLSNLVNSIIELPQKLWEKISDGLKSLFIPSEGSITEYKGKLDTLLENRLGAVYQVVNILHNSWNGIMEADETNTINFPSATVNLAGTPFTFGGYDVSIVPAGFDVLVTAIKAIVAIVCTVAFANGLRKRYDEVMGVEQ